MTDETVNCLEEALLFPTSDYEHALILSNTLITYILLNDFERSQKIERMLSDDKYELICAEQFRHIRYLSLLYYENWINGSKKAIYSKKLLDLASNCEQNDLKEYIMYHLTGSKVSEENRHFFYHKMRYRPTFIGYWQMEVDPHIID